MDYEVSWMPQAKKKLEKLSQENTLAIIKKVEEAKANPQHFLERLAGTKAYKLRIGDYRVIIDLKANEKKLEVLAVWHRKDVYLMGFD
ncbi:type II toxin-antitoxin system RelE/ParE family toxin [Candidatus Woesearchaeota archaeon]|nr:type II toxin-antitoxin system RelE/ParE family toxin [Candidatus Woesearchaeota archaeon]